MAKSRRKRGSAAHRRDPLTKPVKPPTDPELAALREAKILPIIKELQSAEPKARTSAASAIASIIEDTKCRKLLLREQIVHTVLGQTLTDAALESRAAGWGILQVIAQEEEPDFCVHLYRLDILTAIEHGSKNGIDKLTSRDPNAPKPSQAEKPFLLSIALSMISLCTALAEAQDEILEAISHNNAILEFIFKLVVTSSGDDADIDKLRAEALACLLVLSEDNERVVKRILSLDHQDVYAALLTIKGWDSEKVSGEKVLTCAILHRCYAHPKMLASSIAPRVSFIIPTLTNAIAEINPGTADSGEDGWSSPFQYQRVALDTIAAIATTLDGALEADTLNDPRGATKKPANRPTEDEDTSEDDDMSSELQELDEDVDFPNHAADGDVDDSSSATVSDEDDEMDEDDVQADMEMVTGADGDEDDDDIDAPKQGIDDMVILKSLLNTALPKVIRVASFQADTPNTQELKSLALAALNNISWYLSRFDCTHKDNAGIKKAWFPNAKSIWELVITPVLSSDTTDVALATQVVGLAWALARSLGSKTPMKPGEHLRFISLYEATRSTEAPAESDDPFQSIGVKCIGVLGQLGLYPAPVSLNRDVGQFLINVLARLPETAVAEAVEALGQLFDIYGDEEAPCEKEVFWQDNFLKQLEDVLPKVKTMIKSVDKRSHPELRTRTDEAVINLTRFVAYKRMHKPQ